MGDPNLSRLFAGMEELSLKKQLPLRQTAQKPMLKYQPVAKQLQAYHQSETLYTPHDGRNAYGNYGQPATPEPMVPAPFRISRSTNSVNAYRQGGQNYISPNNIGKPTPAAKTNSNPYARPLSAKDIVNDLQNQNSQKIKKTKTIVPPNSGQNQAPFPVNSFMRPQSAVKKEIISRPNDGYNSREQSSSSGSRNSQVSTPASETPVSAKPPVQKTETPVSGKPALQKNETPLSGKPTLQKNETPLSAKAPVQKTVTSNLNLKNGQVTIIETNGATVIQKVTPPVNFGSQINNIINKVTENSKGVSNGQTKPTIRQVSSIPKPGSASTSHGSKSSSPEVPSKFRNLNYTPTKPYSEVMDPSSPEVDEPVVPTRVQSSANKPLQTTATNITSSADAKPKSIINNMTGSISATYVKTTPIETHQKSSNGSNTMFYRKGSKSEEMVHEQRPPAIGGLGKGRRVSEKEENMEEDEEEGYEDDDTCSGPGYVSMLHFMFD